MPGYPLFAISIQQPWASLIAIGEKQIENRDWRPNDRFIGADIVIHAAKTYDFLGAFELKVRRGIDCYAPHLPRGAAVAVARLAGVVTESDDPWFVGPYGWVFENIQAIEPITCSGNRGLWCPHQQVRDKILDAAGRPFDLDYYLSPPKRQTRSANFL